MIYQKEGEMTDMSTIKFDVEDSKVSGILQDLLNSSVVVKNVEVTNTQHSKAAMVSEPCIVSIEDLGSSFTIYRHNYSIGQNEGTSSTEVISGAKRVGGTIFFIDDTADGEYQFFDTWGNPVENVQVGDRPYYYRVVKKGSKDKFYVYHDDIYKDLRWTYFENKGYAYESLSTSKNTGSGKANTEIVIAKDSGTYVRANSNRLPTIWFRLQQVRSDKETGCDDWFVPSIDELELLRLAIKSGSVTGGIIAGSSYNNSVFNNRWIWSSSEFLSQRAWYWHYANQCWDGGNKGLDFSVIFIRAF